MHFSVDSFGLSDIGLVRTNNEDAFLISKQGHFYALADGMGGHLAGEVAAKLFIQIAEHRLENLFLAPSPSFTHADPAKSSQDFSDQEILLFLSKLFRDANQIVFNEGQSNHAYKGMGTTACCCLIHNAKLFYAHVGDSRIYLFRKRLTQLTTDHSLRQELIDKGCLTQESARRFPQRNVITKAIGRSNTIHAEVGSIPLESADRILLCSDGLSDSLHDHEIEAILSKPVKNADLSNELVLAAKAKGGHDNVTVVLVHVI